MKVPHQVTLTTTNEIESVRDLHMDKLRRAEEQVDSELNALEVINRAEAIKKIAELMEISSQELIYFMEYGEEESERLFNLSYGKSPTNPFATNKSTGDADGNGGPNPAE